MSNLNLLVILGTGRAGRQSNKVADFVYQQIKQAGHITELIDVRNYGQSVTIPAWEDDDDRTKSWRDKIKQADAFVIVAPEYNHSFPGELKLFLDQAQKQFQYKPAAICGVSAGGFGGVRVALTLLPVLNELQVTLIRNNVYFSGVGNLFDESGKIMDQSYVEKLKTMLDELTWYANALKAARE